jgi:hypothetical protein
MINVLVGILAPVTVAPDFAYALARVVIDATRAGVAVDVAFERGCDWAEARNRLADRAMTGKYDYLWFLDADTLPPASALRDLLAFAVQAKRLQPKVGAVSGLYFHRISMDCEPVVYWIGLDSHERRERVSAFGQSPFCADWTGAGCLLVPVGVFRALIASALLPFHFDRKEGGEDKYFCALLRNELHLETWVVPTVECGHIVQCSMGPAGPMALEFGGPWVGGMV